MTIQAYCDKSQTIHAVNLLDTQEPPPPVSDDCEASYWINELDFGSERYNVVSKLKKKHMPTFTLESGVRIVVTHKLTSCRNRDGHV